MKIEGFTGKFGAGEAEKSPQAQVTVNNLPKTAGQERPRPDASFKIKDSLRQVSQGQPVAKVLAVEEKAAEVEAREAIHESQVVAALEKYVAGYKPEPTVAIALKTHRPGVEGEKIIIAVDNQLQLDKVEALRIHLQNFLMKTLNNGFLNLSFKLFDEGNTTEEKKLFTSNEKFEHFLKLNPVVANLKAVFGLELE